MASLVSPACWNATSRVSLGSVPPNDISSVVPAIIELPPPISNPVRTGSPLIVNDSAKAPVAPLMYSG